MSARMLGRAGWRMVLIHVVRGNSRRCHCPECAIQPAKKTQRTREKRAWKTEAGA